MNNFKTFFSKAKDGTGGFGPLFSKKKREKQHIALFSNFFSDGNGNLFCTNEEYMKFKNAVLASVGTTPIKEKVVLDIFETESSDEDTRDMRILGYRRYIGALFNGQRRIYFHQFLQVAFFAALGVLEIFLLFKFDPGFAPWLRFTLETVGTVLFWQFVGYLAFEYPGQKRELDRLKQIKNVEFTFRKWE